MCQLPDAPIKSTLPRFATTLLLASLVVCQSVAAQESSAKPPATQPGSFDVKTSRIFVLVKGTGLGHSHGMEAKLKSGHLILGASENAGQMVFDIGSFAADTLTARKAVGLKGARPPRERGQVTKEMLGRKVLNKAKYPAAKFNIQSCQATGLAKETGLPTYQLTGKFTLLGKSRQIVVPATVKQESLKDNNDVLHLTGKFALKQTGFGIRPFTKGFGAVGVADQLTIHGDFWLASTAESLSSLESMAPSRSTTSRTR